MSEEDLPWHAPSNRLIRRRLLAGAAPVATTSTASAAQDRRQQAVGVAISPVLPITILTTVTVGLPEATDRIHG